MAVTLSDYAKRNSWKTATFRVFALQFFLLQRHLISSFKTCTGFTKNKRRTSTIETNSLLLNISANFNTIVENWHIIMFQGNTKRLLLL